MSKLIGELVSCNGQVGYVAAYNSETGDIEINMNTIKAHISECVCVETISKRELGELRMKIVELNNRNK